MSRADFYTVDLFAGAGGLTEGFHQAGFKPILATDFDPYAAQSFQHNFPDTAFIEKPIADISSEELLSKSGLRPGELGCLLGGPPCQAFSVYNHKRGFHDERSGLFREYLRVVELLLPKVVVIENVTGITSVDSGRAVDEIHTRLTELGYHVEHRVLLAEEYGVPQERRRIFFIASRIGRIAWPEPTHANQNNLLSLNLHPLVTVEDAIGDLPSLELGEGTDQGVEYSSAPRTPYQHLMRKGCDRVTNHAAPRLSQVSIERMKHIPIGGSWRDLPFDLLPAGMQKAKRSDHTKRYGRLSPDGLASTILTKCDLHWGAYIHPIQDRTLTVREAARFQSFPDQFHFLGPKVEQYRQVGNAVPPLLAYAVAQAVKQAMLLHAKSTTKKSTAIAA